MKRTWRTCAEHPNCQEEIQETQWDDRENSLVVVHHRGAQSQDDAPRSPERFIRTHELVSWVDKLDKRAAFILSRAETLETAVARLERAAYERAGRLDARAEQLDLDANRLHAELADMNQTLSAMLTLLDERTRPWYQRMKGAR